MSSQPMAKTTTESADQKTAKVLSMDTLKLREQARLTRVPPKAANLDDDLEDFWDNVPL